MCLCSVRRNEQAPEDLRKEPMMAHLLDSLDAGQDIGHYERRPMIRLKWRGRECKRVFGRHTARTNASTPYTTRAITAAIPTNSATKNPQCRTASARPA